MVDECVVSVGGKPTDLQNAGGVRCISTPAEAAQLIAEIRESGSPVGIDCETENVDPSDESPVGKGRIACWSLAYFPKDPLPSWGHRLAQKVFIPNWGLYEFTLLRGAFRAFLESDWPKVGHNFTTFDAHMFENHGVRVGGVRADTLRKSKLLNSTKEASHGLKDQMYLRFGYKFGSFEELFSRPKRLKDKVYKKGGFVDRDGIPTLIEAGPVCVWSTAEGKKGRELIPLSTIPEQYPQRMATLEEYATLDAKATLELDEWIDGEMAKVPTKYGTLRDLNEKLWHPMLLILNRCERNGFRIDCGLAAEKAELAEIHQREYADNLRDWNPNIENWGSNEHQVAPFLYQQLKLPIPPIAGTLKSIQKPDTQYPTSEASLYWLELWANKHKQRDVAIGLANLRGWRKTTRALQDLNKLPGMVDVQGRLHPVLAPETDTGRLSCRYPNLQAVAGKDRYRIREIFIASPGHKLVVADYSQLEIYVLAHILKVVFKDDSLERALLAGDIYGTLAKGIWPEKLAGIDASDIKHHPDPAIRGLRDHSKITVLSANYCKGPEGLALSILDETGEPRTEDYGRELIEGYFKVFPGVPKLQAWLGAFARKNGFVPTLWGRRRPLPWARAPERWMVAAAERQAANTPMQGGGADIMTEATVRLNPYTGLGVPVNEVLYDSGAMMNLQVHDELIYEVPDAYADEVAAEVKNQMESDMGLSVQLRAEVKVADCWAAGK